MSSLLEIKNLSVDFMMGPATVSALKNISFTVNKNEIVAIVGESGSGKSVTSLSILQLLASPPANYRTGEIWFSEDGRETIDLLKAEHRKLQGIRGNKIAMIFQEPMTSLNPVLKCGQQVMEAILTHKKIIKPEAKKQAIEWLAKVKLPDPERMFERYPHELSGGQKQRIMIAMAMCCHPSLLICDEPTTALDVTVQRNILQLIKELQQQSGMGVIFITHDLGVVTEIADRVIVMYKGEIVEESSIKNIFTHTKHPYTKALLACRPVNHVRGERLPVVSDFLEVGSGKWKVGNGKSEVRSRRSESSALYQTSDSGLQTSVLLSAEHLSVWFPAKKTFLGNAKSFIKAVDDVSFDVYKGETLGLVGESGCGKTTLGRTLLRLTEPTRGKIFYEGIDLTAKKKDELRNLRKEIQIVFQDPYSSLNPRITIGSAIAEPLKVHGLFSTSKSRKEKTVDWLEKVGLKPEHFNRYPHELSGGQRQRIVIARALALNPSFIVCDESVSALDVSVQAQVLNLLNDLKKEMGFTTIFISHDLSVVRYLSDRIIVMNKGKIEEIGPADEVYFNPASAYTKQLIASIPAKLPSDSLHTG
jgi:peptide/nickel transport system ATP-binding protein